MKKEELTKREYFAAMMMKGSISSTTDNYFNLKDYARGAVRCADALIEALSESCQILNEENKDGGE